LQVLLDGTRYPRHRAYEGHELLHDERHQVEHRQHDEPHHEQEREENRQPRGMKREKNATGKERIRARAIPPTVIASTSGTRYTT
jgi:hypothetical protein